MVLLPSLGARAGDGAGRGGRPARRRPGLQGVRRSVASRRPGSPTYAARARSGGRCSGRRRTSTRAWWPGRAATRRPRPRPARRCSPSSTRRSPTAARGCAARCAGSPARSRPPRRPCEGRDRPARAGRVAGRRGLRPDRRGAQVTLSIQPEEQRSVTVRAPAKINLHLGVGAPAQRRVPPARHRLPGGRAVRRRPRQPTARATWRSSPASYLPLGILPEGEDNIVAHAARLLADHGRARDGAAARRPARREADPGRRRDGRRVRRRGRHAGRAGPALGAAHERRRAPRPRRPAGQRRAVLARRRHRARRAAAASSCTRCPTATPGGGSWCRRTRGSRRRRSTAASTRCSPTHRSRRRARPP